MIECVDSVGDAPNCELQTFFSGYQTVGGLAVAESFGLHKLEA